MHAHAAGFGLIEAETPLLALGRSRAGREFLPFESLERFARAHTRADSEKERALVGEGDDPAFCAVRAVADPCRAVADGRGRHAKLFQPIEPTDAGLLAPYASVAKDH